MQKAPPFNPLRLVAPALLAFCFILFFLPWVELLSLPSKSDQKLSKEEAEKLRKELGIEAPKLPRFSAKSFPAKSKGK